MRHSSYKYYVFAIFILIALTFCRVNNAFSTHIVGGEIELRHLTENQYQLSLFLYFDEFNGDPRAKDPVIRIDIFSKRTNGYIQSFDLPVMREEAVPYTQPRCAIGSLITSKIIYQTDIRLNPARYSDQEGYYMVYQRCCRNETIENIDDPGGAGSVFYLEFPALLDASGNPFFNSSPSLFPPISDYACLNRPFSASFKAIDPDGDSLHYSLIEPLSGFSSRDDPYPDPISGPYPNVSFLPSYQNDYIVGSPSLSINPVLGKLEIVPTISGLHVFSVLCEEFRDGKLIGALRRDFQILVIDCPLQNPPQITSTTSSDGQNYIDGEVITFDIEEDNSCFQISTTDVEVPSTLFAEIIPVDGGSPDFTVQPRRQIINEQNNNALFTFCLTDCPIKVNETIDYIVRIGDNSCSQPLYDTTLVKVRIIDDNSFPELKSSLTFDLENNIYYSEIQIDESLNFNLFSSDLDGDDLRILFDGRNFDLAAIGATTTQSINEDGETIVEFSWMPNCSQLGSNFTAKDYFFTALLQERNSCGQFVQVDELDIKITVQPKPFTNEVPEITANLNQISYDSLLIIDATIGDVIAVTLKGIDEDSEDLLSLKLIENEFLAPFLERSSFSFTRAEGNSPLEELFEWEINCNLIELVTSPVELEFPFVLRDRKECEPSASDTIMLRVNLQPIIEQERSYPNAFTPNEDNYNDGFTIENLKNHPCVNDFKGIFIYNRWGERVFESSDVNFVWQAKNFSSGQYFYLLEFASTKVKGSVLLLK